MTYADIMLALMMFLFYKPMLDEEFKTIQPNLFSLLNNFLKFPQFSSRILKLRSEEWVMKYSKNKDDKDYWDLIIKHVDEYNARSGDN